MPYWYSTCIIFVNWFTLSFTANLKRSSQKRHREYESWDVGAKKPCYRSENQQTHTPKPTAGILNSTSPKPSSEHPPRFSAITTGNQCGEPLCDLKPSTKHKSHQSSCSSVLLNSCRNVEPAVGVRQAFIKLTPNSCIALEVPPLSDDGWLKEYLNQNRDNCLKADTLSPIKNFQKDMGDSQQLELSSCISDPPQYNMPVLSAKYSSRGNVVEEKHCNPSKTASKPNSGSVTCPPSKQRSSSTKRCSVHLDDISDLFRPDPLTYNVNSANPKLNGSVKSTSADACPSMTSSKPVTTSNNKVTGSSNLREESPDTRSLQKASPVLPPISPMVVLKRICVETTVGQLNPETVKSTEKRLLNPNVSTCTSESDTIQKVSPVHCSETPSQENQACEESKQQGSEDPLDMELDLDLRFALDLGVSQSSNSSEEEEEEALFSLHEIMNPATQPLDRPEKETPSEPSTHGYHSESKTVSIF